MGSCVGNGFTLVILTCNPVLVSFIIESGRDMRTFQNLDRSHEMEIDLEYSMNRGMEEVWGTRGLNEMSRSRALRAFDAGYTLEDDECLGWFLHCTYGPPPTPVSEPTPVSKPEPETKPGSTSKPKPPLTRSEKAWLKGPRRGVQVSLDPRLQYI